MPEFTKWVNNHRYDCGRLSPEQNNLRAFYTRLINLVGEPAFKDGKFFPLNPANRDNPAFGRLPGESASGHWLYAFLRYDISAEQRFLVVANLHPVETLHDVRIQLPSDALRFLDLDPRSRVTLRDRLSEEPLEIVIANMDAERSGIPIDAIPPLSAFYLEVDRALRGR